VRDQYAVVTCGSSSLSDIPAETPPDSPAIPRSSSRKTKGKAPARSDADPGDSAAVAPPVEAATLVAGDDGDIVMDGGDDGGETPRKGRPHKRAIIQSPTSERDAPPKRQRKRISAPGDVSATPPNPV
jgi:hypothetical protein